MLRFTIITLLFLSGLLHAQCETDCPEDQEIVFRTNQTDSVIVASPPASDCDEPLYYTVRGPKFEIGSGSPDQLELELGTTLVSYAYSNNRFGNFTDSITYLPDGDGTEYSADFQIEGYEEGATVSSIGGLTKICMLIEHSFVGDLDLWVLCPNGQELPLIDYDPFDQLAFQILGGGDETTVTPDELWLYCWSVDADRTMEEYVEDEFIGNDEPLPAIAYAPTGNFSSLDDCPLNGQWAVRVRDNIVRDQGYIGNIFLDFGEENLECSYEVVATFTSSAPEINTGLPSMVAIPNPAQNQFQLSVESTRSSSTSIFVYNADGKITDQLSARLDVGTNTIPINTSNWPAGVYIVRVVTDSGERAVRVVRR